jgi:hypothetical protein
MALLHKSSERRVSSFPFALSLGVVAWSMKSSEHAVTDLFNTTAAMRAALAKRHEYQRPALYSIEHTDCPVRHPTQSRGIDFLKIRYGASSELGEFPIRFSMANLTGGAG